MPISAKDKAVIVTGGAGEMGSSIARRLVDEGAKVVIADIADGSALADELVRNGNAIYVKTDVTTEESTKAMARATIDAYGRIDALVNNAGLFTAKPWDELTLADWRERFTVNVEGTFLAAKAVVPAMTEQGRGRIINIGSDTVWMGTPVRPLRGEQRRGTGFHARHRHRVGSTWNHERIRDTHAPRDSRHPRGISTGPLRLRIESHADRAFREAGRRQRTNCLSRLRRRGFHQRRGDQHRGRH
jgi:NAD(P)-dependent dehydrogenase (short-subunit alcohol dehydrogenase family)